MALCRALNDASLLKLNTLLCQQAETEALLDQLSGKTIPAEDLEFVESAKMDLLYQSWVQSRREHLNLALARQRVAVQKCTVEARIALGRVESLVKISGGKTL